MQFLARLRPGGGGRAESLVNPHPRQGEIQLLPSIGTGRSQVQGIGTGQHNLGGVGRKDDGHGIAGKSTPSQRTSPVRGYTPRTENCANTVLPSEVSTDRPAKSSGLSRPSAIGTPVVTGNTGRAAMPGAWLTRSRLSRTR
jgi:hypothetical protein